MPYLMIQSGNGAARKHPFNGDLIRIGRNPDNTIVVDDESVSGQHAEISLANGLYTLRDLQSSNGTTVNGAPVIEIELHDGDAVCFGSVESRFHNHAAAQKSETSTPQPAPDAKPESTIEAELHPSFGSKLASFGKAALGEAQRNARLAALKTRIEKLKLVDLNKAHYALGKKGYELRIRPETFGSQYDESAEIERSIVTNRAGVTTADTATAMQKVKDVAVSTGMKAEAERLNLKLKQQFVKLGQDIDKAGVALELATELEELRSVRTKIQELQKEYATTSANHFSQGQLKSLSASIAEEASATSRATWSKGIQAFKRRFPNRSAGAVLICIILLCVVIVAFVALKRPPSSDIAVSNQKHQPEIRVSAPSVKATETETTDLAFSDSRREERLHQRHGIGVSRQEIGSALPLEVVWRRGERIYGDLDNHVGGADEEGAILIGLAGPEEDVRYAQLILLLTGNKSADEPAFKCLHAFVNVTAGSNAKEWAIQQFLLFCKVPVQQRHRRQFEKRIVEVASSPTGDQKHPVTFFIEVTPAL